MNASKAKRRLMRWYRYISTTNSVSNHKNNATYHRGHVKAYSDVMYAKRWSPNGIRIPWVPTSAPGNERDG